MTSKSQGSY